MIKSRIKWAKDWWFEMVDLDELDWKIQNTMSKGVGVGARPAEFGEDEFCTKLYSKVLIVQTIKKMRTKGW